MKRLINILIITITLSLGSCTDLDILPINIVQDEDIFTESGMKAYMASLYSRMPVEDFKSGIVPASDGFNHWNCIKMSDCNTGTYTNREINGFVNPAREYWSNGYQVIRYANHLIEQLPNYKNTLSEPKVIQWGAEAHFIRAFTYFELAKRYGGLPLVDKIQRLSEGMETIKTPRSSEKATFDFILNDLDYAIQNLNARSENKGRANKHVAAAFKARVALHAGSIARYGTPYTVDGIMLCGIPKEEANNYFKIAFEAAKSIENEYSLYRSGWVTGDKNKQADNYANLFLDEASTETIFSKGYYYPNAVHSWDAVNSPTHMTSTYGDRYNFTLDFVELFDGLELNEKGELKTIDENGQYIVYPNLAGPFANAEPRLRGTVLLPGMAFKGTYVDLRRGILKEDIDPDIPIDKFLSEGATTAYSTSAYFKNNVVIATNTANQTPYILTDGTKLNPIGRCGPLGGTANASVTGFHGRKFLVPDLTPSLTALHKSTQSWVELRYAEILLIRAEAAMELFQNGGSISGVDLQQDAFECINAIRDRAGAVKLASKIELNNSQPIAKGKGQGSYVLAPTRGLQIIRIERRKELAMENKLWWDMLRWRTADQEVNNRTWRICCPFLFASTVDVKDTYYYEGKYIFDCRTDERNTKFTVDVKNYYEPIPESQISSNEFIKQNPYY